MNGTKGFTYIEALIVMGVMAVLYVLATPNLFGLRNQNTLQNSLTLLVSDIKQQQSKAMMGSTEGRTTNDNYGVYFGQNTYTLFHGQTYQEGSLDNINISLNDAVEFSAIAFPGNQILFSSGSGELVGYQNNASSAALINTISNARHTISINRYGIITDQ